MCKCVRDDEVLTEGLEDERGQCSQDVAGAEVEGEQNDQAVIKAAGVEGEVEKLRG